MAPIRFRVFGKIAFWAAVLAACGVPQASASTLTAQATLRETGTWSSNPLMVTDGAESLWGSTTSPELLVKHATPNTEMDFDLRLDQGLFDQTAYNSTDVHIKSNATTRSPRWTLGIKKSFDYDTTRTSEISTFGVEPVVSRHMGASFAPTVSFAATPVDLLSLTGTVVESRYDKTESFTNYRTFSVEPSYTRQLDPLNAAVISFQARRYTTTEDDAVQIDSLSPSLGWQWTFSERLTARASFGAQTSREKNFGVEAAPWTWQYVFSTGLAFKGEQDQLDLTATRAQFPYANGTEALQTTVALDEKHAVNQVLSLDLGMEYRTASYQEDATGNLEDLASGKTGLTYYFTEDAGVSGSYRYRTETLTHKNNPAEDHTVALHLTYRPNMWTLLD